MLACCLNRLNGASAGPYGDPLTSEALHTADPGYDSSKVVPPLSVFLATQTRSQAIAELQRLLAITRAEAHAAQIENELLSARLHRMAEHLEEVKTQLAQTEAAAHVLHNDFYEFLRSISIA